MSHESGAHLNASEGVPEAHDSFGGLLVLWNQDNTEPAPLFVAERSSADSLSDGRLSLAALFEMASAFVITALLFTPSPAPFPEELPQFPIF